MNQALARAGDPLTSVLAADKVNVNFLEKLILLALATHGPLTVSEIARCVDKPRDHISPRMKSLVTGKLIFYTGTNRMPMRFGLEEERLKSVVKARRHQQQVWAILPAGADLVKDEALPLLQKKAIAITESPRVRIKEGWVDAGKTGRRLAEVYVGQLWSVVVWDDGSEGGDPDCHKSAALEVIQ